MQQCNSRIVEANKNNVKRAHALNVAYTAFDAYFVTGIGQLVVEYKVKEKFILINENKNSIAGNASLHLLVQSTKSC